MLSSPIAVRIDIRGAPRQDKTVQLRQLPFQTLSRLLQRDGLGFGSSLAHRPKVMIQLLAILLALLGRSAPRNTHARPSRSATRCRGGGHRTPNRSTRVRLAATQAPSAFRKGIKREATTHAKAQRPGNSR